MIKVTYTDFLVKRIRYFSNMNKVISWLNSIGRDEVDVLINVPKVTFTE